MWTYDDNKTYTCEVGACLLTATRRIQRQTEPYYSLTLERNDKPIAQGHAETLVDAVAWAKPYAMQTAKKARAVVKAKSAPVKKAAPPLSSLCARLLKRKVT